MCGFAGVLSSASRPGSVDERRDVVARMGATLVHRGPDDDGVWVDTETGVGLAHRRLSIIDLSEAGRQPMSSACGRFVIVYNGEIYNFLELRPELESAGYAFRGHSDTEVLLAALAQWGIDRTLARINGMFAFALWDRHERKLHLARDRMGKKPLYYGWAGDDFVFGSELKALRAHPGFAAEVDPSALTLFLRYAYVPAPYSIYRNTYKLPQGSVLTLDAEAAARGPASFTPGERVSVYWSAIDRAERIAGEPFDASDAEVADSLDELLRDAVACRLIADVPLGAFLSGGIDSSIVVALMQVQSTRPVRTFTIGFHHEHNEAEHAGAVARHLGTDHCELYVEGEDTLGVIDVLPTVFDEPFADASQIPTLIISRLARQHVTVALSGDGGDELFFGYRRYFRGRKIWPVVRRLPGGVRRTLASIARRAGASEPGEGKLHNLSADLEATTLNAMFRNRVSRWKDPAALVVDGSEPPSAFDAVFDRLARSEAAADAERWMMLVDLATYLTDDILVKVDRASMAASLEVRAPLLDYRVVEMASRLPTHLKFRDGAGKWILRQVLARYVPPALTERPKTGFGAPIRQWLRGALREWGEDLLAADRLKREGFFRQDAIRAMWSENMSGRRKWHNHLWPVLMFQAWLERQRLLAA
jgi:asparagine synthase (glutamine-hydrolysing)